MRCLFPIIYFSVLLINHTFNLSGYLFNGKIKLLVKKSY